MARFGNACVATAQDIMKLILDEGEDAMDQRDVPEYASVLVAIAILVQVRAAHYVLTRWRGQPYVDLDRIEAAATELEDRGGAPATLCRQIRDIRDQTIELHREAVRNKERQQADEEAATSILPDDLFNFDFFAWDPSLLPYQDVLGMAQADGFHG
jgi:hypothetical protein